MADILQVTDLTKYFPLGRTPFGRRREIRAVDGVTFRVREGETVGIVGESGCGKSTVGRTILRLYEPTGGRIVFSGEDITRMSEKELRPRRRQMQMIFQDPYSSLNPRFTVGEIIGRALDVSHMADRQNRGARIGELLETVGLPASYAERYPGEFSGGQRQRVGIARAIACNPRLIVADEPVSALDVSIQAQIVNLFSDIREEFHLAMLFITHNLAVVRHISDTVAVMYLGKIVEYGPKKSIFAHPLHPYTRALLSAQLDANPDSTRERISLSGEVPSPIDLPAGCRFYSRCPQRCEACRQSEPTLGAAEDDSGHQVACFQARTSLPARTESKGV